jgi:hypothetical protein
VNLIGDIHGAPFEIDVPADWNGKLIVYGGGYRDLADHPGEVDGRIPHPSPSLAIGTALYREGWALAGTAYKRNGWAVEEALDDLPALAHYFRRTVARPKRTLLYGDSMGSVPALKLAESKGGFDGYLAGCAIGAGAPRLADSQVADRLLAYDVAFGMPSDWGKAGDVRDDLDFESEVVPVLTADATDDPLGFAKFEFIRLVTGIPGSGLTPPPDFYPNWLSAFFDSTEGAAEAERRAGGPVAQNLDHIYALTASEKAQLAALGLDAEPLLRAMNARRNISAPRASRSYARRFAEYSGRIKKPVLTLHTVIDHIPVSHESAYRETVAAAGRSHLLAQAYSSNVGHCNFDPGQVVAAVNALDAWITTGVAPTDSAFPMALGFVPGFTPPPWPQPFDRRWWDA